MVTTVKIRSFVAITTTTTKRTYRYNKPSSGTSKLHIKENLKEDRSNYFFFTLQPMQNV